MSDTLSRKPPRAVFWGKLAWHPAVVAWTAFAAGAAAPESIEVLRNGKKSGTYRLVSAGPKGESIIAQRAPVARALIERAVYERILPHLAVTAPRYYGSRAEGRDFVWLFLEDVGDERFSKTDPAHAELAARWVGAMHTGATGVAAARDLPDGGPPRYRDHLRAGRHTIRVHLANPALTPAAVTMLEHLSVDLDALESRWAGIEAACTGVPATLTHGDIQRKNIYIRSVANGPALFLIDWETAGWGMPASDLPLVDLPTYWSVVRPFWPHVRLKDVQRLAVVGRIFLQLAGIRWVSPELAYDRALYLSRPTAWLRVLHERLADAVRELEALT
ncbi:MAG: hypothetical protein DMD41_07095 [Gemmatimonadetes bacterium]|nr:MAG: hypothetical protein DMD41_07095 [Gemmatimonadota bacterium]